jgi:hypothetical protein
MSIQMINNNKAKRLKLPALPFLASVGDQICFVISKTKEEGVFTGVNLGTGVYYPELRVELKDAFEKDEAITIIQKE